MWRSLRRLVEGLWVVFRRGWGGVDLRGLVLLLFIYRWCFRRRTLWLVSRRWWGRIRKLLEQLGGILCFLCILSWLILRCFCSFLLCRRLPWRLRAFLLVWKGLFRDIFLFSWRLRSNHRNLYELSFLCIFITLYLKDVYLQDPIYTF